MTIMSGSYVSVRKREGDYWWSLAGVGSPLKAGDPHEANVFFVERLKGDGPIRSGDSIRIRGVDKDPWLVPRDNAVMGSPGPAPDEAELRIDRVGDGGPEISLYDGFRLNGVTGDPYFVFAGENQALVTGARPDGSIWTFDAAERPKEIAKQTQVEVAEADGNVIRLGWLTIQPCCTLEWSGIFSPTLRFSEQRMYVYATVDHALLDATRQACLDCLAFAAGVATIAALAGSPGAAPGAFQEAFEKCLRAKGVPESLTRAVNISVKSECM